MTDETQSEREAKRIAQYERQHPSEMHSQTKITHQTGPSYRSVAFHRHANSPANIRTHMSIEHHEKLEGLDDGELIRRHTEIHKSWPGQNKRG